MDNASAYADKAQNELADLRAKVETLMHDRVTPALAQAAEKGAAAANAATDSVRAQAEHLGQTVRERPFMALGVAALAGFVIAQMMRR